MTVPRTGPSLVAGRDFRDDLWNRSHGLHGAAAATGLSLLHLVLDEDLGARALETWSLLAVDPEGQPLASLEIARQEICAGPDWAGMISTTALSHHAPPSSRPFEDLFLLEDSLTGFSAAFVIDEATDLILADPLWRDAMTELPLNVLVLASSSLEGSPGESSFTRRALAFATQFTTHADVREAPPAETTRNRDAECAAMLHTLGFDRAAHAPAGVELPGDSPAVGPTVKGIALMFTGLCGSGKSTIARAVTSRLIELRHAVTLLDGHRVRHHVSAGLGFSAADRDNNVRRIGRVAAEIAHHGGISVCSPIAPLALTRDHVNAYLVADTTTADLLTVRDRVLELLRHDVEPSACGQDTTA